MLIIGAWLAGCVGSKSVRCGDHVCPDGNVCAPYGELQICVSPDQSAACEGLGELAACGGSPVVVGGAPVAEGTCHGGVCLPIGCGNGRIDDLLFGRGEECDDHNRLSHDGCSSTCKQEVLQVSSLAQPYEGRNHFHAMAADVSRGVPIMFGGAGYGLGVADNGHLEHGDDARWRAVPRTNPSPGPRIGPSLAHDSRRRVTVLFGAATSEPGNTTWEWDGTSWRNRATDASPPPRTFAAMAYDPLRAVTVLFGGRAGSTGPDLGDTWEWDGEQWREQALDVRPAPRSGHAMVFDPARGVIVMIGERAPGSVETWEYDGVWRPIPTPVAPPSAKRVSVAYDGVDRRIVLVGGELATATDDTWAFDGSAWTNLRDVARPPGVDGGACAMEPATGRPIVHGGIDRGLEYASVTARWTGSAWSVHETGPSTPAMRAGQRLAHDRDRRRIVMFGGTLQAVPVEAFTWELGPSGWTSVAPVVTPPAREDHVMIYDQASHRTLVFGGRDLTTMTHLGDTWLWDGSEWEQHLGMQPPARLRSASAYDEERGQVVMFGGAAAGMMSLVPFDDTWVWNGTWTLASPSSVSPRIGHAMAYDPIRKQVVLFGGTNLGLFSEPFPRDTWIWDGASWTRRALFGSPGGRSGHSLVWDAARQRIVLLGGFGPQGQHEQSVWEWDGVEWQEVARRAAIGSVAVPALDGAGIVFVPELTTGSTAELQLEVVRWDAATPYESCIMGDHDQDGLRGCADPDCWPWCGPTCPPGTSCFEQRMTDPVGFRASGIPGCGDGTCTAGHETCHTCAIDCGACPAVCGDAICSPGEDCVGDCL